MFPCFLAKFAAGGGENRPGPLPGRPHRPLGGSGQRRTGGASVLPGSRAREMLGTAATSGCPGIRGGRPRPFVGLSAPPGSLGAWFLGPRGEIGIYQSGLMTPPPPPPVLTQLPRRGSPQVRTDASEHGRPETVITTPWWRPVDSRGTQQGGARSPLVQTRFLLTQMAIYLCPWIPSPTEKSQGAVTPVWPFLPGPPYLSLWKAGRF